MKPYEIWLVEAKTPISNTWEPIFSYGKSNGDIPGIVCPRYSTRREAEVAADFMQKDNSVNTDPDYPYVRYRAAKYRRVK